MGITDSYSGVVVNQNATPTTIYNWRSTYGANWVYQTFFLPADYQRGILIAEQTIPDLSGFQVLVSIDPGYAGAASLDYVVQYYVGNNGGWQPLTSGTVIGSHADGNSVWFDVIFPDSIPITTNMLTNQFRFGIRGRTVQTGAYNLPVEISATGGYIIAGQGYTANLVDDVPYPIEVQGQDAFLLQHDTQVTYSLQQGISNLWCVSPNPITAKAFQADGVTPLLGAGTTACLNFRILGLIADSGTNFLNNEYRSAVVQASPGNTDTTRGLNPVSGSGSNNYWMSPPQPSQFAVQSLYFDVRPIAEIPQYGVSNVIGNPSFEYDQVGYGPLWWLPYNNGSSGTVVDQAVRNTWAYDKEQSLHMQYTYTATNQSYGIQSPLIPVTATTGGQATPITLSFAYNLVTATNAGLYYGFTWFDSNQNALSWGFPSVTTLGISQISSYSVSVPANAAYFVVAIFGEATAATGSFEVYIDAVQLTYTSAAQPYFDGDSLGVQWTAQRGQSPSVQIIEPTVDDNFIVIDGVLVDPITPNMAMNVYYTEDDAYTSDSMTESNWESKLWTRVPEVYLLTQRQQYTFPEPIHAKYMKVEFTNLPAQSYDPGPFQKPITYKKFPTWVVNFFLSQMDLPSFIASQVNVQYDALRFAYDYYLDDLGRGPAVPTTPPQDMADQLTAYFNANSAANQIDATTLAKINLDMHPYRSPAGSQANPSTQLGSYVQQLITPGATATATTTAEGGTLSPLDLSTVSSLNREPVVLEQSMPVMYFFLTSRHAYKELTAPFEYNRAYFAGINDIAFLRNDYTVAADTPLYIETGGDPANVEMSDWVLDDDKNWYTYG